MTETVTFRSAFSGFNRNEVIAYIGKMLEETKKLQEQIVSLEKDAAEKSALLAAKDRELLSLQERVRELETSKEDVARIGAAMFDARRFSDQLIGEANDRAEEMFDDAAVSALSAGDTVESLMSQMNGLMETLESNMTDMLQGMSDLGDSLAAFDDKIDGARAQFRRKYAQPEEALAPETDSADAALHADPEATDGGKTVDTVVLKNTDHIRLKTGGKGHNAQRIRKVRPAEDRNG